MPQGPSSFPSRPLQGKNRRLTIIALLFFLVIEFRLGLAAIEHDNGKGFWLSSLHMLVVGAGVIWCLWKRSDEAARDDHSPQGGER